MAAIICLLKIKICALGNQLTPHNTVKKFLVSRVGARVL
jgi:hypothetical protein